MLPGTRFLQSGGLKRYQVDRALAFYLLTDSLDGSAAGSSALQTLAAKSGADLVAFGSSFFWHHARSLYDEVARGAAIPQERLRLFLVQLFDSFFPLLRDSDCVALPGETPHLVMPCLGLRVRTGGHDCRITRLSPRRIGIVSSGPDPEVDLEIDLDEPGEHRLPAIALTPAAQLLFSVDSLLDDALTSQSIADLSAEASRELADLLKSALELIRIADPPIAEQMDAIIRWYFPIKTQDKRKVHNSFSVSSLHGAIFLSESYSFLHLAEALVHEFHHNELWMAMAVERHVRDASAETFYSPWRTDARPLVGLYHGTYVFTGLLEFFAAAGGEPSLREHHEHFHAQHRSIYHQVSTALAQIRREHLEPRGEEFIDSLAETARRHGEALGAASAAVPEAQRRHWLEWSARYPELSWTATPPAGVERVEALSKGGTDGRHG